MDGSTVPELLAGLGDAGSADVWMEFLRQFSPILRQVIVFSFDDLDEQADCFVFVCEKLAENDFRRLRKFRCNGNASFATWLRVVTRNLCTDWGRKNYGRAQPFTWTRALPSLDQQVFRCVYEQGYSVGQTFLRLLPSMPGIFEADVERSAASLASRLSARERWLLSSRFPHIDSLDEIDIAGKQLFEIPDHAPDPERLAIAKENAEAMALALKKLAPNEQLLLRMRFEQGLTLQEIARIAGFKDPQSADRKIRSLLDRVRGQMSGFAANLPGKAKAASV